MLAIDVIAVGKAKSGPHLTLWQEYHRRMQWPLRLIEIESRQKNPAAAQADEHKKILAALLPGAYIIALDERGQTVSSQNFAEKLQRLQNDGPSHVQIVIGGADGLSDEIRARANLLLSFGRQTWPHRLVRVMLLEQVYRAQQILNRHPYHRE